MVVSRGELFAHQKQQTVFLGGMVALPTVFTGIEIKMVCQQGEIELGAKTGLDDLLDRYDRIEGVGGMEMDTTGVIKHNDRSILGRFSRIDDGMHQPLLQSSEQAQDTGRPARLFHNEIKNADRRGT